jgi:hypothetical protein
VESATPRYGQLQGELRGGGRFAGYGKVHAVDPDRAPTHDGERTVCNRHLQGEVDWESAWSPTAGRLASTVVRSSAGDLLVR